MSLFNQTNISPTLFQTGHEIYYNTGIVQEGSLLTLPLTNTYCERYLYNKTVQTLKCFIFSLD